MKLVPLVVVLFIILQKFGDGAKILAVWPMVSHSHFTLGFRLMKELATRGHEVTVLSPFPQKAPMKNWRDISVEDMVEDITEQKKALYEMGQKSVLGQIKWVTDLGLSFTEQVLKHKNVQNILKSNEKFDVVIMEHFVCDALVIFAHKFNCPLILFAPGPTTIFNNHFFANPSPSSYVPHLLAQFGSEMTLWQRMQNTYYDLTSKLYYHYYVIGQHEKLLKENVENSPDLRELFKKVDLLLLLSHISVNNPVPLAPAIKEIGGYHVEETKPLPKDLQQFLDKATEGVVVFSMGSNIKSADLPEKSKRAILAAFRKIPQKILWKFEEDLPGKSDNVKIMPWLPQQDILAHPNVKAFITHGGLLSVLETVWFGVPMIGIPVYWDQEANLEQAALKGYCVKISFNDLSEETLLRALKEVLDNPKYMQNAKARSKVMHDRPIKPMDEAIYWIEHVIRHKGAPHLRTAGVNLNWFQRHLLDIILILTLVTVLMFVIFYVIIRKLIGRDITRGDDKKNK